jgi:hypothetical protein
MFQRYTEEARRVLFFARYEASQEGSISMETQHLLLGLIRERGGLTRVACMSPRCDRRLSTSARSRQRRHLRDILADHVE